MSNNSNIIRSLTVEMGEISKRADGILMFKPHPHIFKSNLTMLVECYQGFIEVQKGEKSPFYSDNRQLKSVDGEETEFIKRCFPDFAVKAAFYIDSPITAFLHNAFLYLHRPEIPMKIFYDCDSAMAWLADKK